MNEELKDIIENSIIEELNMAQLGQKVGSGIKNVQNTLMKARDGATNFAKNIYGGYQDTQTYQKIDSQIYEVENKFAQQAIIELNKILANNKQNVPDGTEQNTQQQQPEQQQQPVER